MACASPAPSQGVARADSGQAAGAPRRDYRLVALIIACALFMENMDATVLATALPTMARDFGVKPPEMSVTVTAYLLALAVFVPVSGYLADRFGARNVFRLALGLFMAGSIACALSPSLSAMAAARFAQGMGGAMMVPVGRLVLLRAVPKAQLISAMAWLLMPGLIGTMAGPPLGGFIVTYFDWRWIFWINLPIGAAGIVLVTRFIGDLRQDAPRRFDAPGFVLSGLALGGLMAGFELAGPAGDAALGWPIIGLGAVMAALYLRHAGRAAHPILDLSLLTTPTFRLAMIGGSLTRMIQGAQPFLLSLMFQLGFGMTALQAGAIMLATALGTFTMKGFVNRILRRLGFRRGLIIMGLLGGGAYFICGFFRPGWPLPVMFGVLLLAGFFNSFQFTAYNTIAYDEVPQARMSSATSFYATIQQLTLSLGVCVAATVLHLTMAASGRATPSVGQVSLAFFIVAGLALCSVFANIRLSPSAGLELSGARAPSTKDQTS